MSRKLTPKQFELAASKTRKEARTIKMARSVLVDGESPSEVARVYNSSRQQVTQAASFIYSKYIESKSAPPDWVEVKEFFPPDKAKEVIKLAKDLLLEYRSKQKK